MTKKTEVANVRTSGHVDFAQADLDAAQALGVILGGTLQDRITRAVIAHNQAARLVVEAGYLLLSVKAEVAHGEFEAGLESLGLSRQRASELMQTAKFITALPEAKRAAMLQLPKTKVLALASADPEVVSQMLEDGDFSDLTDLSVRGLRQRIRELEAKSVDLAVQRDTAQAQAKAFEKKARRARDDEDDFVPVVVADIRAEGVALLKKAELALTAMHPLGVETVGLSGHAEAHTWIAPTLRLHMSGLLALRQQLDGLVGSYAKALGEDAKTLTSPPDGLAFLDQSEIASVAEDWARLTALHQHEAALRKHERDAAKPKGKGRPVKAPEPPKA